jgi:hypothetical protein
MNTMDFDEASLPSKSKCATKPDSLQPEPHSKFDGSDGHATAT